MGSNTTKDIAKLFESFRYKHDLYTVFSDWCACAAIAFSNAADLRNRDKREARYLDIVKKYHKSELLRFSEILGEVTLALESAPSDVLGTVFHDLELHNSARGQYFTPYPICSMMARINIGEQEDLRKKLDERGFICAQEPACGSGAMMIALAETMRDMGFNYQQCLHVTAIDVDPRAVHMAYIQFTLLHIPAVVLEGNALSLKMSDEWCTLAHIMGGWGSKLKNATLPNIASVSVQQERLPTAASASRAKITKPSAFEVGRGGQFQLF